MLICICILTFIWVASAVINDLKYAARHNVTKYSTPMCLINSCIFCLLFFSQGRATLQKKKERKNNNKKKDMLYLVCLHTFRIPTSYQKSTRIFSFLQLISFPELNINRPSKYCNDIGTVFDNRWFMLRHSITSNLI